MCWWLSIIELKNARWNIERHKIFIIRWRWNRWVLSWDVKPCSLQNRYQHFEGTSCSILRVQWWINLLPWIQRLLIPPVRWYMPTEIHGVTSQKVIFIYTAMRSWNCRMAKSFYWFWKWNILKKIHLTSSTTERLGPRNDSLCFQSRKGFSVVCTEPAITCRHCLQHEVAAA